MIFEPFIISNPNILHIELGCGCGNFGKIHYSECFASDKRAVTELRNVCTSCYVDFSCSADSIPAPDNRFDKLIICNPYNYGFRDKDDCKVLLSEFTRVVKNNGSFIIVSSNRNPYANQQRIVDRITEFNVNPEYSLTIIANNLIDPFVDYPGYTFYDCDGNVTVPNFKIEVQCTKS